MEKSSRWLALGLSMGIGCSADLPPRALEKADTTTCTSQSTSDAPFQASPFLPRHLDTLPKVSRPPLEGSVAYWHNREVFTATRPKADTPKNPRWEQARLDVAFDTAAVMAAFSQAIHITLTPSTHPKVASLLRGANIDLWEAISLVKRTYNTKRPFLVDPGEICENRTERLAKSPDFPSGHAAIGRLYSLILADLFPAQAGAIYRRGITYGESRVLCGSHTLSAVKAGAEVAEQIMNELIRTPAYKTALQAARLEVSSTRNPIIPVYTSVDVLAESPLLKE